MNLHDIYLAAQLVAKGGDLSNFYSKSETDQRIIAKVAEIVSDAPEDFDTLKELSDWIANHEDSAAAMNSAIAANTAAIAGKVDQVTGKGLSTNDFTDADKSKLDSLENYDDTDIKAKIAKTDEQAALNRGTLGYQRKNLLPNTATTKTVNGITFTVNEDRTVTANGTAAALVTFAVSEVPFDLEGKKLRLSGCPTGGNYQTGYALYIAKISDGLTVKYDTGNGVEADIPDEPCNVRIVIRNGVTVSNLVFKPMLRYAEIADDTYEPYKPSVEERLNNITNQIFGRGTNIPSNADLNDYTQAGVYYSASGSNSATLENTPYKTGGFRLEVSMISASTNAVQKLYPISRTLGCFFVRVFTDGVFGSWFKFSGEEITA